MSFDPATVAAFVDGELDDFNMRRIEREAATDAALAAEIARHRALKARLSAHYAPVLEEAVPERLRSEEHTSELQSLMRTSYAVFCLKKTKVIYHDYTLTNY